jgi:hypothetical protein
MRVCGSDIAKWGSVIARAIFPGSEVLAMITDRHAGVAVEQRQRVWSVTATQFLRWPMRPATHNSSDQAMKLVLAVLDRIRFGLKQL